MAKAGNIYETIHGLKPVTIQKPFPKRLFLEHFYPRKPEEISKREVEDYLIHLAQVKKYGEATIHTAINAIKFYYEQVLQQLSFHALPADSLFFAGPKKSKQKKGPNAKNRCPNPTTNPSRKSLAPSHLSNASNGFLSGSTRPKIPASAVFAPCPPERRNNSDCINIYIEWLVSA